tara:strand:+ start:28 stop:276 length:249 start_codon:yes stop_codon:yes gene_type:complete
MIKNKEQYVMVKERQSEDVIKLTFTKKERRCDTCLGLKKAKDIAIVQYPILHKTMGRIVMTKKVCTDCHSDVMDIINSLKYN